AELKTVQEQEEPMLECTGGDLYLTLNSKTGTGKSNTAWKRLGIEHETEATEAGERRKQQEIINNHAIRLNKKDGFVADWADKNQLKYYACFNEHYKKWRSSSSTKTRTIGHVAMSPESISYLCGKLNKGLIKGVNANGDI
ncbi:MAG: hypothetical protein GY814_08580, partial [Gammaproteobacteria bacterium]|nr:hypothetical protein [Gammaproteobacteria bacterium]